MIKIKTYTVGFENESGDEILNYTHDINQAEKTFLDCVRKSKIYEKIYIIVDNIDVKEYLNKNQDNLSYLEALKICKDLPLDSSLRETKKIKNKKRMYAKCGIGGLHKQKRDTK